MEKDIQKSIWLGLCKASNRIVCKSLHLNNWNPGEGLNLEP